MLARSAPAKNPQHWFYTFEISRGCGPSLGAKYLKALYRTKEGCYAHDWNERLHRWRGLFYRVARRAGRVRSDQGRHHRRQASPGCGAAGHRGCAGRHRRRDSGDARLRHQQHARQYRQGRELPRLPAGRRAYRLWRRQGTRHREDRSHRAQEDRLHRPDDLFQLLGRDRHCRRVQRRRLARGIFVPQPTCAYLHQPQDYRRSSGGVLLGRRGRCPVQAARGRIRHERR